MFKQPLTSHSGLTFRPLHAQDDTDIEQLIALECQAFSSPWNKKQYLFLLESDFGHVSGVFENEILLGYIAAAVHGSSHEVEIYNISVAASQRRQGLGKCLLYFLLHEAKRKGMERAVLETRVSNLPAIALYEGLGFTRCGLRKFYYADTGEDAIVYELQLENI